MLGDETADCRVSRTMESIAAIEKPDHRRGVEDYRHSSRSPSTCPRNSPPVRRLPE